MISMCSCAELQNKVCTFISIISFLIVSFLKVSYVYGALFFFSLLIFSIAIDGNEIGLWDYMYVYDSVVNSPAIYIYWFFYLIAFFCYCIILRNTNNQKAQAIRVNLLLSNLSYRKVRLLGRCFAIISFTVGLFNVLRVGNVELMFIDPRAWEMAFGKYFLLNYIYFLHTLGVVFLVISLKIKGEANFLDCLLIVLCIVSSTFHGVKFTVLHVFTFLIFTSLILNAYTVSKNVLISILVLALFFVLFFSFIRGGGVEGIVGYIVSASVNSMYRINNDSIFEMGSFGAFFPFFDPELYSKFAERAGGSAFSSKGVSDESGFMLNDKYNLFSAITTLSLTGPVGFLFCSSMLAFMIRFASVLKNVFHLIVLVFLLHVLLMFFTAWEFYKYKLIFILAISYMIASFVNKGRIAS